MNCRPSTVQLLAFVFLVIAMQTASAGEPTIQHATVTATILNVATNDVGEKADARNDVRKGNAPPNLIVKYIDVDGHIATAGTKMPAK